MHLLLVNLLVVGLSSALFMLGVEVFHRYKAPYRAFGGAYELTQFRQGARDGFSTFVIDPAFGFHPVLGEGPYTRFGTLANGYAEAKAPGVRPDVSPGRL